MKFLIICGSLLLSNLSFAESAKMTINPFAGELSTHPRGLKITSVSLRAVLQHCNLMNSTCAGGPQTEHVEMINFKKDGQTNLIKISSSNQIQLKSVRPFNRFSSCKINLTIKAINDRGERMEGFLDLVHENDKSRCESQKALSEQMANIFKVPQLINFWNL